MTMIRKCEPADWETILEVIEDGARAYRGVIPPDCLGDPYMSFDELRGEIRSGVEFWCHEEEGEIAGVMGIQHFPDVTLIRHAYVRQSQRRRGTGGKLLAFLRKQTALPILLGTWADARWALRFYEKNGFRPVGHEEKERLLRKYWSIPVRQIETSVVLADEKWPQFREKLLL
jgi:GNAT superfamily N-acetyltransferase